MKVDTVFVDQFGCIVVFPWHWHSDLNQWEASSASSL